MKFFNKKVKVLLSVFIVVVIALSASFLGSAENVVILEETDPELTFVKIHEKTAYRDDVWADIKGEFTQDGSKTTMTSNGFAQWYEKDSLHFAYKKVIFNYGKTATLIAETTMTSWNGKHSCAGAGLMIRSGIGAGAATVMLHARPAHTMITYRSADGMGSIQGNTWDFAPDYPVTFRMVLNKNKVECYVKDADDASFAKLGAVPFTFGTSVYIGQSAYSQAENDIAKATFDGFSYQVEAPEGTEVSTDETESSGGGAEVEEEEETLLPADPSVAEDVLLYETFTDGSISEGEASVTNPIWKTNNSIPEIITTEDNTNRYLYDYMGDNYYLAGDEHWTDYETSLDITFTDDSAPMEANLVDIYTRLTSIGQYGYHAYVVRFYQYINQEIPYRSIQLGILEGQANAKPTSTITVVDEYKGEDGLEFDYLDAGTMNLTIRTFDNTIAVYLNGTEILSYKDESNYIKAEGKIGFSSNGAAVTFDNIKVVGLTDLLGGDYDNEVADLWDVETPAYIQEYIDKGYVY